ncbi:MAG: riboflavin synthase [Planctomycetes bacterium]|nr:riboflavin synthase [Planctomycetota bacterium]
MTALPVALTDPQDRSRSPQTFLQSPPGAASVNNSNGFVIQDITLDAYGHISAMASSNLDNRYYTQSETDLAFVDASGDTITISPQTPAAPLTPDVIEQPIPTEVIPCCVDVELFSRDSVSPERSRAMRKLLGIAEGEFVLVYLGNIGTWYMLDEMLQFFQVLLGTRPDARFLFITHAEESLIRSRAEAIGVPERAVLIQEFDRRDVPACLTVADRTAQTLAFDVVAETLGKSTLGSKRPGDRVNLERSLQVGDRLDGHFVQGHVDGTACVTRIVSNPREHVVWLRPQPCLRPYMIPKGSVAVDGVSLTLAAVENHDISVALIPTTLDGTTLSSLAVGDSVNIETDIIARTVVQRLSDLSDGGRLTLDTLEKAGFA